MRSRRAVWILSACLALAACERERPHAEPVEAPAPVVVTDRGEIADPETARAVGEALDTLQNGPAEPPPPGAEARDASALHGRWRIRHTIYRTNGEAGEPSPPLMPTTWDFTPDGAFRVRGANTLDLRYMYTGDRVIVTGMGPAQDYRVDRLTDSELHLTSVIEAGSLRLENTTVLDRARE